MMVSTKGRYALRVMIDLAEHNTGDYVPLKEIIARQQISQKYAEGIMTTLSKAGLIDALHGKGGGYKLNRPLEEYTAASILNLTEGTLAPVACLENSKNGCENAKGCRTLPMWQELDRTINDFFERYTLADLVQK